MRESLRSLKIAKMKREIMETCWEIYSKHGYNAINYDSIAEILICSRTTIYNYYDSVEDIFVDIFKNNMSDLSEMLESHFDKAAKMKKQEYCDCIAHVKSQFLDFLKASASYMKVVEKGSKPENFTELINKCVDLETIFHKSLTKFFPNLSDAQQKEFIYQKHIVGSGIIFHLHHSKDGATTVIEGIPQSDFTTVYSKMLQMVMDNL